MHYRTGFAAGLQGIVQFGHLAVQPSLHFSQKGLDEHSGSGLYSRYTDYRLNYLLLPVNVAYSLHSGGQGVQVFAGPYVGMLLGGNYQVTSEDRGPFGGTDSYAGDIAPGDTYTIPAPGTTAPQPRLCRRFDVGLQAGLGYRYGKLLAQVDFAFGLNDLYPMLSSTYNRTAQASLSYLLTPKR
ncbi:MAG: PorT family protein [Hymenobacter sp.]|nr:MAG: PorT family protein [Hymenobacter sp.]